MSKFDYMAEGELNSQYLLDLLNDYLDKIEQANDIKGIVEDNFNINTKANKFVRFFKDRFKRIKFTFTHKALLENYNKVLVSEHIKNIKEKIAIFLQTNVLEPRQIVQLKSTLTAIKFNIVLPEIDEYRHKGIKQARKRLLTCLNDIKYLKNASIDHILFNSPVRDLKPFMSNKVTMHKLNIKELSKLVKQFIDTKCEELNYFEIDEVEPTFKAKPEDFYAESIIENGIGAEVEEFIRDKMEDKFEILNQEDQLPEVTAIKIDAINKSLKKLKLLKIEQMMQKWVEYKTNIAHVKEVVDNCKELINSSTLANKKNIFLIMDNLYYKLTTKCDQLQGQIKLKLQLVDKQKVFAMIESMDEMDKNSASDDEFETLSIPQRKGNINNKAYASKGIASNLYDDEDEQHEIHISEDDTDSEAEEEIVIDDKN